MANRYKNLQEELKQMVVAAVAEGVITPNGIVAYLVDNGWKYELPTRPTIIKFLALCGIGFISGYWTRVK